MRVSHARTRSGAAAHAIRDRARLTAPLSPALALSRARSLFASPSVIDARLRVPGKRERKRLRRAGGVQAQRVPGVLQTWGADGLPCDMPLDVPLAALTRAQDAGLLVLQARGKVKFCGPLFTLRVHPPAEDALVPWMPDGSPPPVGEPPAPLRVRAVNILVHPLTNLPVCVGFVPAPVERPVRVRVPVRPMNAERCPGVKTGGWVNVRQRAVDVAVRPGVRPPLFATMDVGGLELKERLPLAALEFEGKGQGCRLVLPQDTVSTVISSG